MTDEKLLDPPTGRVRMVLDTDTDNEIDDQFALCYSLLSPERLNVEAVYAAPYHNGRSIGPADGMRRSHDEIHRVLARMTLAEPPPVFEGATDWLPADGTPPGNPAADDLVRRALAGTEPLYVVAIGAPTNVSAALLRAPEIADRIVVVWLGGNPTWWPTAREFNLQQDLRASRTLFDSGVPLVHVPCINVTQHLRTTEAEVDRFVAPAGDLGAYLAQIYRDYYGDHTGRSKEIWDLGAVAWLVDPSWSQTELVPSPVLRDDLTWAPTDPTRHRVREMRSINRDPVFRDLFAKLAQHA